jgi:hypothetical protein
MITFLTVRSVRRAERRSNETAKASSSRLETSLTSTGKQRTSRYKQRDKRAAFESDRIDEKMNERNRPAAAQRIEQNRF